jgi:hypothetical protein
MQLPRLTIRRLIVLIVYQAWCAFNGVWIWGILKHGIALMPRIDSVEFAFFACSAYLIGSASGWFLLTWAARNGVDKSALWRFVVSLGAAAAAGFVGWGTTTLLFYAFCGTNSLAFGNIFMMPVLGAVLQMGPGILIGYLWGARVKRLRRSDTFGTTVR